MFSAAINGQQLIWQNYLTLTSHRHGEGFPDALEDPRIDACRHQRRRGIVGPMVARASGRIEGRIT
jgi:hypothetical protein